jgi:Arc/MetJ family transcription regulator
MHVEVDHARVRFLLENDLAVDGADVVHAETMRILMPCENEQSALEVALRMALRWAAVRGVQ